MSAHVGGWAQVGVAAFAGHLLWQTLQLNPSCAPDRALKLFRSNRDAGLLLFFGFLAESFALAAHS
jgi:4-hydroxybenzoate polyprenyltransferase